MKNAKPKVLRRWLNRNVSKGPMRDLAREVLAHEPPLRVRLGGHNALVVYPPDGSRPISLSGTASDHHAADNARASLRRAGVDV